MAIQFLLPNDLKCIAGLFCEKNPRITVFQYKMSLWRYGVVYDWNMRLNMDNRQIRTLEQVKQFVDSSQE